MHAENVVLHAWGACMLFALLSYVTRSIGRAGFVAAVWAVHPMHVESVAWLTERRDVLSTPLLLTAMLFYCRYVRGSGRNSAAGWYAASVLFYTVSLTAKATGITAPIVFLLLDYWPLQRKSTELRRILLEKIPFALLAIPVAVIAMHGQRTAGAIASLTGTPLGPRLGNAIVSCVIYVTKLTIPTNLCVLYPFPAEGRPAIQVLTAAVLIGFVGFIAVRTRRTRPYLLFGFAWFLVVLSPVSGITQAGMQSMADRYSYVPSIGFFVVVAWGGFDLAQVIVKPGWLATRIAAVVAAVAVIVLALLARNQLQYWRDTRALYTRAVDVTDDNWSIQYHLGLLDAREGNYTDATSLFEQVISEKPDFPDVYIDYGNCLYLRSPARSLPVYDRAVELNPTSARALTNRGNARLACGDPDGARADYVTAARLGSASGVPSGR